MAGNDWLAWIQQAEQLFDQKRLEEAASLAQRALQQNPRLALAHQVLGLVSAERGAVHDAIARLSQAVALRPDLVPSHNGLGRCYAMLGDTQQALEHFETALRLEPNHAFARFNRAMTLLKLGRFHEGWLDYEWRYACGQAQRPNVPRPRWDGSPLNGRSLMVHTEQGLGDVLQFVRFLPLLKRQDTRRGCETIGTGTSQLREILAKHRHPLGASPISSQPRIVFACQTALHDLLRSLPTIDEWFPIDEPGTITFDLYTSLLSLPGLLGVDEATIPREVPYLDVSAERVERWRPAVGQLPGFKVGVVWQGSPTLHGDRQRSIPLAQFAPLAAVPGVTLVSLQKGAGVEQIPTPQNAVPLTTFDDLDRDAPFVDTAAILQHLDLVITIDSAVAHLAGACGRPVWVLLSTGCDWRWLTEREDSPWYPTMRLFRQRTLDDWNPVFHEIAAALRAASLRRE